MMTMNAKIQYVNVDAGGNYHAIYRQACSFHQPCDGWVLPKVSMCKAHIVGAPTLVIACSLSYLAASA